MAELPSVTKERVDALIDDIVRREGGFVDHPADRGGATKYGITIGTLRDWRRQPVGRSDVASLTEMEARQIYRTLYFTATGFDQVPDAQVQALLFDFAVHSGISEATKALQRAIGAKPDGVIGPLSLEALKRVTNMEALFYRIKCERFELITRFIGRDNAQAVFATGWANRFDEFERSIQ